MRFVSGWVAPATCIVAGRIGGATERSGFRAGKVCRQYSAELREPATQWPFGRSWHGARAARHDGARSPLRSRDAVSPMRAEARPVNRAQCVAELTPERAAQLQRYLHSHAD
ncbi:hypothetical protein ACRS8P_31265 [Burkholderia cenocepacia]